MKDTLAVCDRPTLSTGLSSDPAQSAVYVWYVIFVLSVVNAFNYMDRMALAVLAPLIKADLQLTDAQLGVLSGFAFAIFYAVCGLPISRLADRGNRRDIIAAALAVWSVMTAFSGAAQSFWHLFVARVGIASGEAGGLPAAQSMVCDYVPLKRRSGVFAVHTFGLYAGMMLGMMLAGRLGEIIGWRWTFVVLGMPGVALAVLVKITVREPPRGCFDVVKRDGAGKSLTQIVKVLWRCRTYRLLAFFCVVNGFVQYGLNQWWPSFYARVFGLSLSSLGAYLGIALGAGTGVGLLIGGILANKAARRNVRLPLVVGAAATLLSLPASLGSLFVPSVAGSLLLVALTALLWGISLGPVTASLYSVTTPQMRATAGAIAVFLTSAVGLSLGPLSVGWLSDDLAASYGRESVRYALLIPISFLPVMVVLLCAAASTLSDDLARAGFRA